MSDYFKRARAAFRSLLRAESPASAAGSPTRPVPPAEQLALASKQPAHASETMAFADAARAATEPASWIDTFDAAVARNVPVADASLAIIRMNEAERRRPDERVRGVAEDLAARRR